MGGRQTFHGIGASPGITCGRVFLLDRRRVRIPRYHIQSDQVEYEIARLRTAITRSVEQLELIRSRFSGKGMDHQAILEAHEMMLRDEALMQEAAQWIRTDLRNAEWAVSKVIARLRGLFDRAQDNYFRERRSDIDFVGERILRNLVGQTTDLSDLEQLQDGTILVAHDLSPADTAVLMRHRITAFITEAGGKTSHTSIIARSLGVPAVVGVPHVFDATGSGDMVLVDGFRGEVVLRPNKAQLAKARRRASAYQRLHLDLLEARALPAETMDNHRVHVTGNIELPNEVATVLDRGGEGIGLFRTEFMYLGSSRTPGEEDHYRTYCQLLAEVGDRPVTIRTLDLGGDKSFGAWQEISEPNPALGLRAIRICLERPDIFEPQIAGLLRAAVRGDLRIMLPMISGLDELRAAKSIIAGVQKRLRDEGKEHRAAVPIGIMIEVPSAVMIADLLAREADFFSIGTNDLMQYLLAIDRTNERVAYLYNPLHPAVLRTLQQVVTAARNQKIPVSVCGEIAGEPLYTPILVGFGFDQISMNAGSIPQIKRLVRELHRSDCESLLQAALGATTPDEVTRMVEVFLQSKSPAAAGLLWDA